MSIDFTTDLITFLLLLISGISGVVSIYWHLATRGTWRHWPAGRSVMALLVIIMLGFGWRGVNVMLGDYPLRHQILIGLYTCFASVLIIVGATIRKEMAVGKKRMVTSESNPETGLVTIIVTTTTDKENLHGKH